MIEGSGVGKSEATENHQSGESFRGEEPRGIFDGRVNVLGGIKTTFPREEFLGQERFAGKPDLPDVFYGREISPAPVFTSFLNLSISPLGEASAENESASQEESGWGGTTDPRNHDPKNFRYLVHGFNPLSKSFQPIAHVYELEANPELDLSGQQGDQTIDLVEEPERVAERVSLSMSLIDQDHIETWGHGGIIVDVPEENILLTGNSDLGTANSNIKRIRERSKTEPKLDPDDLLHETSPTSYNEVVAEPRTENGEIVPKGFFIKVFRDGKPLDRELASKLTLQAMRLGLPLVRIAQPSLFEGDTVDITDTLQSEPEFGYKNVAVHLDRKRYLLYSKHNHTFDPESPEDNWKFSRMTDNAARFMAPDELDACITYLGTHAPEVDTDEIRAEYQRVDAERQAPRLTYDEDGSIQQIRIRSGYKDEEVEVFVTDGGYSGAKNLEEERRQIALSMSGGNQYPVYRDPDPVLSPQRVDALITQVRETADEGLHEKLDAFAEKIRDGVSRAWEDSQEYGRKGY
jgi:hypothetical protein